MSLARSLKRSLLDEPKRSTAEDQLQQQEPPSVVDLIDEVLERKARLLHFFRPSMIDGCDRANVFHYQCAPFHPQRQGPRMMRILDNGTAIHEVVQGYLGDCHEWWFAPEARIYTKVAGAWVRGSCDGVLIRRSDGYRVGVEIKTINHSEWMKLTKPKPGHVAQASVYARLQGLTWIVVLYWDKGTQDLKEFPVKYDAKRWRNIKARIRELKGYVDRRELPKFDPATCDTTFCAFVDVCRKKGAPV